MIQAVTGTMFNLNTGRTIVHNEQDHDFSIGDVISFDGKTYKIARVIPPSKPGGKWSLVV